MLSPTRSTSQLAPLRADTGPGLTDLLFANLATLIVADRHAA